MAIDTSLLNPTLSALSAAQHFEAIQALPENQSEPQNGAIEYAKMIVETPNLDALFCQQAGKVVHIVAKLAQEPNHPVTLRGELSTCNLISWNTDYASDNNTKSDLYTRTFTIRVPVEHAQENMQFKLCLSVPGQNSELTWATGDNWNVDLSKRGFISVVNVSGVSF